MNPKLLSKVGNSLYGVNWRTALAAELHVAERTVRRWASGESAIPPGIAVELATLCERQGISLFNLAKELKKI